MLKIQNSNLENWACLVNIFFYLASHGQSHEYISKIALLTPDSPENLGQLLTKTLSSKEMYRKKQSITNNNNNKPS